MKSRSKFRVGDVLSWEDPKKLSATIEKWDNHCTGNEVRKRSLHPHLYKIHTIDQYGRMHVYRYHQWYYAERVWASPIGDAGFFESSSRMETGLKKVNKLELLIKHNIT